MVKCSIPSAAEQLEMLQQGLCEVVTPSAFAACLERSSATQTPLKIKTGFDPTAADIHLGHAVLMEKMAQFQRLGHEIIFVVGDYTALIGDPTGRNIMRPALSSDEVLAHAATYRAQATKILDPDLTRFEWNSSWLSKLTFRDTISLASKYNVSRMLERRDFKNRFVSGQQIALHELLYPLMQGYDSVILQNDIELGGAEQIFNLNVGRHLMEAYALPPQVCLTVPLLIGLDGVEKMSKSKGNHIGVTEPAESIFGKTMSISDNTMAQWFPVLTGRAVDVSRPLDEKKWLAHHLVTRFHGKDHADQVLGWWNAGRPPLNVQEVHVPAGPLFKVLVASGLAASHSDARRKIEQGSVSLNGNVVREAYHVVGPGLFLLRVGKRHLRHIRADGAC